MHALTLIGLAGFALAIFLKFSHIRAFRISISILVMALMQGAFLFLCTVVIVGTGWLFGGIDVKEWAHSTPGWVTQDVLQARFLSDNRRVLPPPPKPTECDASYVKEYEKCITPVVIVGEDTSLAAKIFGITISPFFLLIDWFRFYIYGAINHGSLYIWLFTLIGLARSTQTWALFFRGLLRA